MFLNSYSEYYACLCSVRVGVKGEALGTRRWRYCVLDSYMPLTGPIAIRIGHQSSFFL